ncbi:sunset domain-containing protein [Nocardioides sp. Root140]|uniref:sunset domain-containing protein n=1 Tax=Nocardioides sp. Root140 TaxID=1736460 RepID=UPI0006FB476D|nr:hypothetical protein [Nocardioides sp. Root140]KQY64553.1 hypothetical protein ASD30_06435 [Nocardioides sp. Root140]
MGWLLGENWLWVVLAALLGALITLFLTLRKVEVSSVTSRGVAAGAGAGAVGGAGAATLVGDRSSASDSADSADSAEEPALEPTSYAEPESTYDPGTEDSGTVAGAAGAGAVGRAGTATLAGAHAGDPDPVEDSYDAGAGSTDAGADSWSTSDTATSDTATGHAAVAGTAGAAGGAGAATLAGAHAGDADASIPEGAHGPGSADPLDGGASPGGAFSIKGNADSMKFHTEESPYFGRTVAEVWFDSEDAARGAGFVRWDEKSGDAAPAAFASIPEGAHGPGSADPLDGGASPGGAFSIKGNADSMKFHTEESPYFGRTVAEVWFDSEDAARAAGFARWND